MYNVSIFGSYVSRKVFLSNECTSMFRVKQIIEKTNIYSLFSPSMKTELFSDTVCIKELDSDMKQIYYALEKKELETICEQNADILVIDLIDQRLGMLKNPDTETIVTNTSAISRNSIAEKYNFTQTVNIRSFDYFETYNIFKMFANEVRKHFSLDQIIIIEAYPVMAYRNKEGKICPFDEQSIKTTINNVFMYEMQYAVLKELLYGCHFIEFPRNVLADESHDFGLAPFHYESSYYEKIGRKIVNIMNNKIDY